MTNQLDEDVKRLREAVRLESRKMIGNTHGNFFADPECLTRVLDALEKRTAALRALYEEQVDYILRNKLGPTHHNYSMRLTREALSEEK